MELNLNKAMDEIRYREPPLQSRLSSQLFATQAIEAVTQENEKSLTKQNKKQSLRKRVTCPFIKVLDS